MLLFSVATALAVPSLDEPLRTGASISSDAAVVIGVEDYAFVPDVPYARRDAHLVHDLLVYTVGVPAEQVQLLTDPSREQIQRALDIASAQVQTGGTLWVYFAGHGAAAVDDGARIVLGVDVQADPAVFEARGLEVDDLAPELPGVRTVALLDTCYAGVGRSGGELVTGKRFAVPAWATEPSAGRIVWSAASANELASPLPAVEHGAFTWLAVGALRGWADGELDGVADGEVALAEAEAWVGRALRGAPLNQQPELVVAEVDRGVVLTRGSESAPRLPSSLWEAGEGGPVAAPVQPVASEACPWPEPPQVDATMTSVVVDGTAYVVAGKTARSSFRQHLQACGYVVADDLFRSWRATRRTTNATMYPFLGVTGIVPAIAGTRRKAFVQALESGR